MDCGHISRKLPLLLKCSHIHKDSQWQSSSDPHVYHEMCREQQVLIHFLQYQPEQNIWLSVFNHILLQK